MTTEQLDIDLAIALSLQDTESKSTVSESKELRPNQNSAHDRKGFNDLRKNAYEFKPTTPEDDAIQMAIALSMLNKDHASDSKNNSSSQRPVPCIVPTKPVKPNADKYFQNPVTIADQKRASECKDDEMIAILLQESDNDEYEQMQLEQSANSTKSYESVESPVKHDNSQLFNNPRCCYGCKKPFSGRGSCLIAFGVRYHNECFRCDGCDSPICGNFIPKLVPLVGSSPSPSGNSNVSSSSNQNRQALMHAVPYHQHCAQELYAPRCCLCSKSISGKYSQHMFFRDPLVDELNNTNSTGTTASNSVSVKNCNNSSCNRGSGIFCTNHQDTQDMCSSCNRLEPLPNNTGPNNEPFVRFPDGRAICSDCISTAVLNETDTIGIYQKVLDFMEKELSLLLPPGIRDVPVLSVDVQALNTQTSCQGKYNHGSNGLRGRNEISVTRGLTLSSMSTVIEHTKSIQWTGLGRPMTTRAHFNAPSTVSINPLNPLNIFGLNNSSNTVQEIRAVTAILVLYGLPWHLTASILAHEAMHAYCKLTTNISFHLPSYIEEGLCQYVSYQYLEFIQQKNHSNTSSSSHTASSTTSSIDCNWAEQLIEYFKYQIKSDTSEVYGRGYREVTNCCGKLGLQITLEEIIANPTALPCV